MVVLLIKEGLQVVPWFLQWSLHSHVEEAVFKSVGVSSHDSESARRLVNRTCPEWTGSSFVARLKRRLKLFQWRWSDFVPPQCSQGKETLLGLFKNVGHVHSPA